MNKKAIAILGAIFLLIIGTLGFLIYTKYYGKEPANTGETPGPSATTTPIVDPSPQPTPTPEPPAPTGPKIVKLSDDQVVSPVLFYNGNGVTYFDKQGQLFQASIDDTQPELQLTRKKMLDIPVKAGITKILWPSTGDDFIAEITTPGGRKAWSYYNSQTGSFADMPSQITAVDWMPGGKQILYLWLENGKSTLNISDPDTNNWKEIAEMWETDDTLSIAADGLNILYYRQDSSDATNPINSVTSDGKVWKPLVKEGYNFGVLWSPDSKKFVFGKRTGSSQKYGLWLYDLTTEQATDLKLTTTVDKVVWGSSGNLLYAAVPTSGTAGEGSLTSDMFFKVNITSGELQDYKITGSSIDGRDLFLSKDGTKLFYRNAQDGGLYYLDLSQ